MNVAALVAVTSIVVLVAVLTFSRLRREAALDIVDVWLSMLASELYNDMTLQARASEDRACDWIAESVERFADERQIVAFAFVSRDYVVERVLDFLALEHTNRNTFAMTSSTWSHLLSDRLKRNTQ